MPGTTWLIIMKMQISLRELFLCCLNLTAKSEGRRATAITAPPRNKYERTLPLRWVLNIGSAAAPPRLSLLVQRTTLPHFTTVPSASTLSPTLCS